MKKTPTGLQDYLDIARRRVWWLVLPSVLITLGVFFGSLKLPRVYESEATIMIEPQKVPSNYVQPTISVDITDRIQNIRQEILSLTRLRKIISDLGLYDSVPGKTVPDEVVEQMRKDISVDVVPSLMGTDRTRSVTAFRIAYVGANPVLTQKVTRNLASLFVEENLKNREQESEGTTDFLDGQLEKMRQSLQEQEKRLETFKAAHAGELPEQQSSGFQMIGQMQTVLQSNADAITRVQQQKAYLSSVLEGIRMNQTPQNMKSALQIQLDMKSAELLHAEQKYQPNHPDIRKLNSEIAALKSEVEAEKSSSVDGKSLATADQVQVQMAELDKEIALRTKRQSELERNIQEMQSRIGRLPQVEQQLAELTRDYQTSKASYDTMLGKRDNSSVAAEMERRAQGEQFRILDPASFPDKPLKPNLLQIDILGLLAGLFGSLGLALVAELADNTMNTDRDLAHCSGLPVLACLSYVRDEGELRRAKLRRGLISAATLATVLVTVFLVYMQCGAIATGFGWKF